jgi:class 3 adenylate cyclase
MRVALNPDPARLQIESRTEPSAGKHRSLRQEMEEKIDLDSRIEAQYAVEGSFVDVDVVNSYGMKSGGMKAEFIIVSFERFRSYVEEIVTEFDGHVLNSNGDELMCYFQTTLDSVKAASEILARLHEFNLNQNLLRIPFAFRIGIHTGRSLVDLDQGVAYSAVLDTAGHLQKLAEVNQLVISEETLKNLPEDLPFERVGRLEREEFDYYRLTRRLE